MILSEKILFNLKNLFQKFILILKKNYSILFFISIFCGSFILAFHNSSLYEHSHGFDGKGHLYYIQYVLKYWRVPPPNLDWETHQSPLYFFLSSAVIKLSGQTWKISQFINIFILWMIIGLVGIGIKKILRRNQAAIIGMISLASLPMLNIFPPMLGNELLSTFWIIATIVSLIFFIEVDQIKSKIFYLIVSGACFVIGYWTKVSIVTVLPLGIVAFIIVFFKCSKNRFKLLLVAILVLISMILSIYPLLSRSKSAIGPSNVVRALTTKEYYHSPDFYYRMDWITKLDIHRAHYYSLWGGAWNSFWTDGHNAITPFVEFHKKAFVLWLLGFLLFPISLFGLYSIVKKNLKISIFMFAIVVSMIAIYTYLNVITLHYSAARLTYVMGIVFPYAVGIAAASEKRKLKFVILFLLTVQFATMVSFYWIQPWWHVTR